MKTNLTTAEFEKYVTMTTIRVFNVKTGREETVAGNVFAMFRRTMYVIV